mmetsp:Transcript_336/g.543  ORF Transcript_336/g.543 Transcript_336/m.543 type:complete len:145 (-) Transcript_336:947-1381(-)
MQPMQQPMQLMGAAAMNPMQQMQPMQQSMQGMPAFEGNSMSLSAAPPTLSHPTPSPAPTPPASIPLPDVSSVLANLDVNTGGSNSELIRMLAEEVVRLRKALAAKRLSTPGNAYNTGNGMGSGMGNDMSIGTAYSVGNGMAAYN